VSPEARSGTPALAPVVCAPLPELDAEPFAVDPEPPPDPEVPEGETEPDSPERLATSAEGGSVTQDHERWKNDFGKRAGRGRAQKNENEDVHAAKFGWV
jgi:hypothetical protein